MIVPFPTPDGPVTTRTFGSSGTDRLAAQIRDQLVALALGEPTDRLARRDAALGEDPVDLHAPVFRDREQQVEDLGGRQPLRRIEQEPMDLGTSCFEVALEPGTLRANLIRTLERVHSLGQRALRSRAQGVLRGGLGGGRHGGRFYTRKTSRQGRLRLF